MTGTVVGIDSTVLVQAQVRISGSDRVVLSDGDGRFRIARVTAGEHVLEVHRLGYRAVLQPVTAQQQRLSIGSEQALRSVVKSCIELLALATGNDAVREPSFDRARRFAPRGIGAFRNRSIT